MSNLLLLADVAFKKHVSVAHAADANAKSLKVDACVQTDSSEFSAPTKPFPNLFTDMSPLLSSNNKCVGRFFELPNLPPLHDYVKQNDFDFVVNATHDYYSRVALPDQDNDLEHSYAFQTAVDNSTASCSNAVFDEGCFESIANLDEYMGISTAQNSPLLFEEIAQHDDATTLFIDGVADVNDEFLDQISFGSIDPRTVVQLDELDVDELINYIGCIENNTSSSEACEEIINIHIGEEVPAADDVTQNQPETQLSNIAPASTAETANTENFEVVENNVISTDAPEILDRRCEWDNCEAVLQKTPTVERHVLNDHLKKTGRCNGKWLCLWKNCRRKDPFSERYLLLKHLRSHTGEAPFSCGECERKFKSNDLLKVHQRRSHNGGKPYVCSVCTKAFPSTGELSRHKRMHSTSSTMDYSCYVCCTTFKDESGLRKHRRRVHCAALLQPLKTNSKTD